MPQTVSMFPIDSSVITYIGYGGGRLFLQFWPYKTPKTPENRKKGSIFTYKNVEGWKVDQLLKAPSKGKFINYFLKGQGDPYQDHRLTPVERRAVDFQYLDGEERIEDEPGPEPEETEDNQGNAAETPDDTGGQLDDGGNWLYQVRGRDDR